MAQIGPPSLPASGAELVDAVCGLIEYTTGANRTLTTARLVLFLEASHNVGLRETLSRGRAAYRAWAVTALTRLGAPEPQLAAEAIMACGEGIILHRIGRHDRTDPRQILTIVVRGALGADAPVPRPRR